jgi:hypothetical protein
MGSELKMENFEKALNKMFEKIAKKLPANLRKVFEESVKKTDIFNAIKETLRSPLLNVKVISINEGHEDDLFIIFPIQLKFTDEWVMVYDLNNKIEYKYGLPYVKEIRIKPIN